MGMTTTLYGCIIENGLLDIPSQKQIYAHNAEIINSLPVHDNWPPLTRNMFAITDNIAFSENDIGPNYAYNGRIIHFGGNFKSIELEWAEWRIKFEELLSKLLWLEATVHLQTEYAELFTFNWHVNLLEWGLTKENSMQVVPKEFWEFESNTSFGN